MSERIRGVSSAPLIVAGPVLALIAGRWLFHSAPLSAFFCLSLLVVVPLGLLLLCLGLAVESEGRLVARYVASGSLMLGLVLLPFSFQALNSDAFRRSQVERLVGKCENAWDPSEVRSMFATLNHRDYALLSREDHRRAAIQKARFGDWGGAESLWMIDRTSIHVKGQKAVAAFISYLKSQSVSQYTLKQLCIQLYWMGYERQSVYLWRSHYPDIVPADWKRALQNY